MMFPDKSAQPADGFVDLHCHLLPGLDDGPKNWQETLAMCQIAQADGIRTVVATPHLFHELYLIGPQAISSAVAQLHDRLASRAASPTVVIGAEVAIRPELLDRILAHEAITVADTGRYLLVEPPSGLLPDWFWQGVFRLAASGMTPIVTHPERCRAVQDDPNILLPQAQSGVMFQLTGASLLGRFGRTARRCAVRLLQMGVAHVIATDAHGIDDRPPVLSDAVEAAAKIVGTDQALRMASAIPERVVAGLPVSLPQPRPHSTLFGFALANPGGPR